MFGIRGKEKDPIKPYKEMETREKRWRCAFWRLPELFLSCI